MSGGLSLEGDDLANEGGERVTFLDQALWAALSSEQPSAVLASAWLTLQCRQLRDVARGVLVLRDASGGLAPSAHWPEGDSGSTDLNAVVDLCLKHRRGIANVHRGPQQGTGRTSCLAYPLLVDGEAQAVVAVESTATGDVAARELMRGLHWGTAWLELALRRASSAELATRLTRSTAALDILAIVLNARGFANQARAAATEIATRTGASRAAIGWRRRHTTRVIALSHGVAFSRRTDALGQLAGAMDEALDQARTVAFPPPRGIGALVTRAHAMLAQGRGAEAVVSVPLVAGTRLPGAILVEYDRRADLDQSQVDLLEAVAALVGPALDEARNAERSIVTHAGALLWAGAVRLFGPGHLALKLACVAVLATTAFFALFRTEYRVGGRATVEGEVRRTIAAAIDGYVASEHARAGQSVRKDALLAALDQTEFALQRLRWNAVREQHQLELSKDLAAGQRADVNILRSQMDEADAQIALLDDEIARTRVTAPFDGLILSGDLSQSVGAPVQRAQVLFEIAPLDGYRVIVRVPDSEIGRIAPGGRGTLVLSALPDDRFSFTVTSVTPVAEVSDGQNAFRVEGQLDKASERLRPNMEGVARVDVGDELLIWIWTHRLIAAVRLALWSWWP